MKELIARVRRFTAGIPFYRWPLLLYENRRATAAQDGRKREKLRALRRFDRRYGVDFGGYIPAAALGSDSVGGSDYEPSYPIPNLLKTLRVTESDCLIDLGCGKGYAMYCFSQLPFARIDGLEYNHGLAETARANFEKLFPGSDRFRVFEGDAARWTDYDIYTYVYLYNPFDADVIARVCDELLASLLRAPRRFVVLYQAPFHWDVLKEKGFHPVMQKDGVAAFTPRIDRNRTEP